MPRIAIIMPAYNEEKSIGSAITEAKKYGDVMVVDDASRDNTNNIASKLTKVIRHEKNRGLGAALRTGFNYAISRKYEIIVTIDADGQHKPEEIPKFVRKIEQGYDFVLGKRDMRKYPMIKKIGNLFLGFATNFISGTTLDDTESGFRAFSISGLKKLHLKAERYEIAVEIIFEVGRNELKACNVDVASPVYVKGVGFFDGIKNFSYLLHRKKRNWMSYIEDMRYVLKKWL